MPGNATPSGVLAQDRYHRPAEFDIRSSVVLGQAMAVQAASGQDGAASARPIQPIRPIDAADAASRLTHQLNTLSEVVETLTYRLLELEERLAASEGRLAAIAATDQTASAASETVGLRLEDTEERLLRIEAMLTAPQAHPPRDWGDAFGAEQQDLDGPFPEEGEQRFLDELEADAA